MVSEIIFDIIYNSSLYFRDLSYIVYIMNFTKENFNTLLVQNERLGSENIQLRQRVDWLLRKIFGRSSEQIDPRQLILDLEVNSESPESTQISLEVDEVVPTRTRRKRGKRMELPENLPMVEERIIPEEVQAEPEAYKQISEEVFEQLDMTPAQCFRRRIIRPKFVRITDRSLPPVIAPAPKRIIENSIASAGLLAEIVRGKYIEHRPLYRQEQSFKRRFNLLISRKLMSSWMFQLSQMLAMIYESLRNELRAASYLQIDETPVNYLNPGTGKCSKGYLWVYTIPRQSVLFEWHAGRSRSCLKEMLTNFEGFVQHDGYRAYESFRRMYRKDKIVAVACMAQVL
jgi:transposase